MDGSDEYGGRYPRTRGQKRKSDDLGAAAKSACPTPIAPHPKTHPIDEDHPCIDDDKYSHLTRTRHQKSLPAANNSASCMTISSPTSATRKSDSRVQSFNNSQVSPCFICLYDNKLMEEKQIQLHKSTPKKATAKHAHTRTISMLFMHTN
ncbi:uncharacterized protein LOC135820678 isoform X1 [Sycon ciliatum]|uniref:uncharacterized protein LOC135820678 isoform X1 n=1 Tax=Sycon ciliatum TaxID=27933 RepID=UPI0031F6B18A